VSKTRFCEPRFCSRQYGLYSFNHCDLIGSDAAAKFGKITQNKGHCAVQGHSRSPFSVPMDC